MKVELKPIIAQLTECLGLRDGFKVSALVDDDGNIQGWNIVAAFADGTIVPINKKSAKTIKELILRQYHLSRPDKSFKINKC